MSLPVQQSYHQALRFTGSDINKKVLKTPKFQTELVVFACSRPVSFEILAF
jgi:hypothetical protein